MDILQQLLLLALLLQQLLFLTLSAFVTFVGLCYIQAVLRVVQQAEVRVVVSEKPDGGVGAKDPALMLVDVTPHHRGDRAGHESHLPHLPPGGRVQEETEGVRVQVPI